jgi:hypothetical protein
VCMSVIRHILAVFRHVCCFCDANISGQLIQLHGWERKYFTVIAFLGVGSRWESESVLEGLVCMLLQRKLKYVLIYM